MISIIDIARIAKVSPSTVSRALHDHPRISPERRAEIKRLADSLGYRPNQIARGLVTAILCYNDLAAIGLLGAAARAGVRVPGELSVVGIDNIPFGPHSSPALTTLEQPAGDLGRAAVTSCVLALTGSPAPDVVLRGRLVVRESAGPAPG